MKKSVLLLGAGLVAGPPVQYLLDHGFKVTVASRTLSKAEKLVGDHPNGITKQFDITKEPVEVLDKLIQECDLAVSLLPYTYHVQVAENCIRHGKHMLTTSYVSDEMSKLDNAAREAGVTILNEIGVDPGIDHMEAQRIIDDVHEKGGEIVSFRSLCGGLPAPEANTNPYGYKISWSPRGVILAGTNDAKYLEDGKNVEIPGKDLFDQSYRYSVEGLGEFEAYPNRDSIPYVETYGIPETKVMFRGTLRNIGWCPTLKKIADMGYLSQLEEEIPEKTAYEQYTRSLMNLSPDKDIKSALAEKLNLPSDSDIIDRLEWMGLLGDDVVPFEKACPLDVLGHQFQEKLQYSPGERDMLILVHEFIADFKTHKEKITSTMIDYGIKDGPSSMSRTVGLPAAIGVRMILEGKITDVGVQIPTKKSIYEPVLKELAEKNIKMIEKREKIN